jgi:hypothetical protein
MNREAFKALPRAGSSSRSASRTDRDDGQLEHTKQSESKRPKRSEGASSYTFPTRRISVLSKRPSRRSKGSGAKLRLVVRRLWWRRWAQRSLRSRSRTHEVSSSIVDTTSQPNYHETCLRLPLYDALNSQPSGTKENNSAEEEPMAATIWKRWSLGLSAPQD